MQIIIYNNKKAETYSTWLNSEEVKQYINPSSSYRVTAANLASWQSILKNYDKRCIEVTVQFNAIQAQNMSGGFCMYIK